jgi:hypothetical protein
VRLLEEFDAANGAAGWHGILAEEMREEARGSFEFLVLSSEFSLSLSFERVGGGKLKAHDSTLKTA